MSDRYVSAAYAVALLVLLACVVLIGLTAARRARDAERLALRVEQAEAAPAASAQRPDPVSRG
jgi:hypothetical protein